jgi:hypothetical protein
LKSRERPNDFKPHSDNSDHVHGTGQQPVSARVGIAGGDFCIECGHRPCAVGGRLSRCIPCIKAEAARARDARKAADARVSKTKVVKLRSPQRMETAELREYIRKITPELIKGLVEVAETSGCEKAREDAEKVLTSRGYVRTAKTSGQEINISWRLKK